ncbi:hypothetical protein ACHAPT_012546 [Fusarium lateritium]
MGALGIRHLPMCHLTAGDIEEDVQSLRELKEWGEILDKDQALIEKLEKLTIESDQEFSNQSISIEDFWWLRWLSRIWQVRREHKAPDGSQKQQLCHIGVVLDDESEQDSYYDSADTYEWDDSGDDSGDDDSREDDSEEGDSGEGDSGEGDSGVGSSEGQVGANESTEVKSNTDEDKVE